MRLNPALGRPFDVSLPSNRYILIATPIVGAIAGLVALLRSLSFGESMGWGLAAGGSAFLAWAIARELHPDRIRVATVASLVAPFGLLLTRPDLLASAVVLLVARAVAGTTGRSMRTADIGLYAAVGIPVAFRASGPAVLGIGAAGLVVSGVWQQRNRINYLFVAAIFAGAAVMSTLRAEVWSLDTTDWLVLGLGVLAGVVSVLGPREVIVGGDRSGSTISPHHVRVARLATAAAGGIAAITVAPATLAPVWAAVIAVAADPR